MTLKLSRIIETRGLREGAQGEVLKDAQRFDGVHKPQHAREITAIGDDNQEEMKL